MILIDARECSFLVDHPKFDYTREGEGVKTHRGLSRINFDSATSINLFYPVKIDREIVSRREFIMGERKVEEPNSKTFENSLGILISVGVSNLELFSEDNLGTGEQEDELIKMAYWFARCCAENYSALSGEGINDRTQYARIGLHELLPSRENMDFRGLLAKREKLAELMSGPYIVQRVR